MKLPVQMSYVSHLSLETATAHSIQPLGFWDDFKKGFGMVWKPATQIACSVCSALPPPKREICLAACGVGQGISDLL